MVKSSKKAAPLTQKQKFLRAVEEENCEPIEIFEKKLKKMSRVKKLEEQKKPKK
jgi:hypothetical protein